MFIFICGKINFNYSILIGLIFYSILIYYCEDDDILEEIQQAFTKYNLRTKTVKGHNYGNMR